VSSQLGYIFEKILNDKDHGKRYYKSCLQLTEALKPKTFTREKWYTRCCDAIRRFQKEIVEREQEELEREKKKVMGEIEADLNEIKLCAEKNQQFIFLELIYKKFKPKNDKHRLPVTLDATNLKATLKEALCHYHPDRNQAKTYGYAWFFTAEFIAKILSNFYDRMKG
jgi:hypothetical protein